MTQITPLPSASLKHTKSFAKTINPNCTAAEATSRTPRCKIFSFDDYAPTPPVPPAKYKSVGDLISEWEADETSSIALKKGRRWIADAFYQSGSDTLRTCRLGKGWSQRHLAELIGTSQPHIARIERGTENVSIGTCRKLADVLGIDLNTLDLMLKRQEAIAKEKQK